MKARTIADERTATLDDWLRCYPDLIRYPELLAKYFPPAAVGKARVTVYRTWHEYQQSKGVKCSTGSQPHKAVPFAPTNSLQEAA